MSKKRDKLKIGNDEKLNQCAQLIDNARCVVALTGAGISTSAGIPDFRGPKGLYVTKRYDPETVFDIDHFYRDPKPFFDFTRDFINLEKTLKPTRAHFFLKELEDSGKLKGVITQNIDSLHQRAGTKKVLELHGGYWKSFCLDCNAEFSYEDMKTKIFKEDVPHCTCGGVIKPDVAFFGENVKYLNEAFALAESADLFFVIGTSCVVQPAASVPTATRGKIVIVNQTPVDLSGNVVLMVLEDIDRFFHEVSGQLKKAAMENGEQRAEVRKY